MTTDVKNLASTVVAGGNVSIDAAHDVNFLASQPKPGNDLNITAGRTFKNVTPTSQSHSCQTSHILFLPRIIPLLLHNPNTTKNDPPHPPGHPIRHTRHQSSDPDHAAHQQCH
ncbi:hypothetical protein [Pseudomonas syringae]|uniref:hypothetical protein n=1 Tax=Pseudomonas syringae TaxID=317 RepID=UPI003AF3F514